MGGKDEEMRVAAHEAWIEAKGDLKAARHVFKKHARSSTCKRPGRFLQRWGKEFSFRKGFKDRKRTGRPRKLSSETANRAAEAFMKGSVQNGKAQPYVSINEGLDMNPELKDIVSTHTMSPRTLLRNMQQVQPKSEETHRGHQACHEQPLEATSHACLPAAVAVQRPVFQANILD